LPATAFYEALFAGRTVGQAVTAGRLQLRHANLRPSPKGDLQLADWIVPVHYARRAVAFPELRRRPGAAIDLAAELARLRKAPAAAAADMPGMHSELELSASGGAFFGRDPEFHELERALRLQGVVVLHGLGGSGKTELAIAFARWLQATGGLDDPSWVFLHSFEPGIATFGLSGVVAAVGLRLLGSDFARLEEPEQRQLVLSALRQRRLLLVWDNFETVHSLPAPGQATPPLDEAHRTEVREFLAEVAREARGGVLITSRSPESWLGDSEIHRLELRGLAPADANQFADMLLAPYPRAVEARKNPAFPRLLEALDGHPLSLRLLLPHLDRAAAQEILDGVLGNQPLLGAQGGASEAASIPGLNDTQRLASLAACVNYSFRRLPTDDQARLPALLLFEAVADERVLAAISAQPGVPGRFGGVDLEGWRLMMERCADAGLLTRLGAGLYRIHPALGLFLAEFWRDQVGAAFAAELAATRAAGLLAHAALADWITQQIEGGHAQFAMQVVSLERRSFGAAADEALKAGRFDVALSILQALNALFDAEGLMAEARVWVDRCRDRVEDAQGTPPVLDTPEGALWLFVVIAEANRALASGLIAVAEAEYNRMRAALEASAPSDERQANTLAATYHQLGRVAQDRGDLTVAESWYRKGLDLKEALGDRPSMASSYHQLGMVAQNRGDLAGAENWYRKSLGIKEGLDNRPGMGSSYHQLGTVVQCRGDLVGAESWYRKSLEIFQELGDRPHMASNYHQLGSVAWDRGDFFGAESWYRKSLEIFQKLGDQPGMASTYHQLGMVAHRRGELADAENWYGRSLKVFQELGDRPHIASGYHQMGRVAQDRGDLDSAESWYRRSLEIHEALGNRPGAAASYHQLGNVAQDRGDLADAEIWYQRALEILKALDNRPSLAMTLGQLGLLAETRGDASAALDWIVRCVSLFPEFPHLATGPSPQHLARLTAQLGLPALEAGWLRMTGAPLPRSVRDHLGQLLPPRRSPP
jgi:tetratricopeptide (TPR) repeat protein